MHLPTMFSNEPIILIGLHGYFRIDYNTHSIEFVEHVPDYAYRGINEELKDSKHE